MSQTETEAERQQALSQGKAVSTVIGIQSMGLGFNRLMTIQIPLAQRRKADTDSLSVMSELMTLDSKSFRMSVKCASATA